LIRAADGGAVKQAVDDRRVLTAPWLSSVFVTALSFVLVDLREVDA